VPHILQPSNRIRTESLLNAQLVWQPLMVNTWRSNRTLDIQAMIDLIGIGALNFDYICGTPSSRAERRVALLESGAEDLGIPPEELVDRIRRQTHVCQSLRTQFGGSAYLAVKAASATDLGIRTAFVGVCPGPGEIENDSGFRPGFLEKELSHLDDQSWIFGSEQNPGIALIYTTKGKRKWIGVAPGANDELGDRLRDSEKKEPNAFLDFLASAQWIHVSSLSKLDDFEFVMNRIAEAKEKNPRLKVSLDPGYQYTLHYSVSLRSMTKAVDFLFLNEKEFENLRGAGAFSLKSRINKVRELVGTSAQVLVVKNSNRHRLIQLLDQGTGGSLIRTYWHHRLFPWQIEDDTGAGDVFAGAFIAASLSPRLLSVQPGAIRVGAAAAAAKLKSPDFPSRDIGERVHKLLELEVQRDFSNRRGWVKLWARRLLPSTIAFLMGVLATILTTLILT